MPCILLLDTARSKFKIRLHCHQIQKNEWLLVGSLQLLQRLSFLVSKLSSSDTQASIEEKALILLYTHLYLTSVFWHKIISYTCFYLKVCWPCYDPLFWSKGRAVGVLLHRQVGPLREIDCLVHLCHLWITHLILWWVLPSRLLLASVPEYQLSLLNLCFFCRCMASCLLMSTKLPADMLFCLFIWLSYAFHIIMSLIVLNFICAVKGPSWSTGYLCGKLLLTSMIN